MSPRHAVAPSPSALAERASHEYRFAWITADEAMTYLGVRSRTALYRLITEWNLPCGRMGRLHRFRRADLDAWLLTNARHL